MECCVDASKVRQLQSILTCMARIGDTLVIEATASMLLMRGLNANQSAFIEVCLNPSRFCLEYNYTYEPPEDSRLSARSGASASRNSLRCKTKSKLLLSVFRLNSGLHSLELKLDAENNELVVVLVFKLAVRRKYTFYFEDEGRYLHTTFDRDNVRHHIQMQGEKLNQGFDNFDSKQEDVTFEVSHSELKIKSYLSSKLTTSDLVKLQTECHFPRECFLDFTVRFPDDDLLQPRALSLTITIKDVKAFATMCAQMGCDLHIFLNRGGDPILLSNARFGDSEAAVVSLILATISDDSRTPEPPSAGLSQFSHSISPRHLSEIASDAAMSFSKPPASAMDISVRLNEDALVRSAASKRRRDEERSARHKVDVRSERRQAMGDRMGLDSMALTPPKSRHESVHGSAVGRKHSPRFSQRSGSGLLAQVRMDSRQTEKRERQNQRALSGRKKKPVTSMLPRISGAGTSLFAHSLSAVGRVLDSQSPEVVIGKHRRSLVPSIAKRKSDVSLFNDDGSVDLSPIAAKRRKIGDTFMDDTSVFSLGIGGGKHSLFQSRVATTVPIDDSAAVQRTAIGSTLMEETAFVGSKKRREVDTEHLQETVPHFFKPSDIDSSSVYASSKTDDIYLPHRYAGVRVLGVQRDKDSESLSAMSQTPKNKQFSDMSQFGWSHQRDAVDQSALRRKPKRKRGLPPL